MEEISTKRIRIEWIDVARGIAIFLVCLGHRDIPHFMGKWIYSFHMPIFFYISGYVTKYDSDVSFIEFLKKKGKGLIIPYTSLSLVYIFLEFVYAFLFNKKFDILYYIKNFFVGSRIGSSWFIIALLVVGIVAYFIHKIPCSIRAKIIIVSALGILGFVVNYYLTEQLIWNIPAAMVGLIFFEAGYISRIKKIIEVVKQNNIMLLRILAVLLVLSTLSTQYNGVVDMWYLEYGNPILFLVGAFSGIGILCIVSIYVGGKEWLVKRIFTYYGKNTLPIIFFHLFPGYWLCETIVYKITGFAYMDNQFSGNIEGVFYAIIVMILMIPIIEGINRWFPWMVGKKK